MMTSGSFSNIPVSVEMLNERLAFANHCAMLQSMAIKFKYRGAEVTADTPEEAAKLLSLIQANEEMEGISRFFALGPTPDGILAAQSVWTPALFNNLLERLGDKPKKALELIVRNGYAFDDDLRTALEVPNNQALAGVLSGISKQAQSLGISPRTVFTVKGYRRDGKRWSRYDIAADFLDTAVQMGWEYDPRENKNI